MSREVQEQTYSFDGIVSPEIGTVKLWFLLCTHQPPMVFKCFYLVSNIMKMCSETASMIMLTSSADFSESH
jgi:hypothetical protein